MRPVSWLDIINKAEKRGSFTELDKAESMSWATCAVGEHRSSRTEYVKLTKGHHYESLTKVLNYNSSPYHKPKWYETINTSGPRCFDTSAPETKLHELGMEFMERVKQDDFSEARRVWNEINALWASLPKDELPQRIVGKFSD